VFMAKPICPISHFPTPVQETRYVIIPNQTGRDGWDRRSGSKLAKKFFGKLI